MSSTTLSLIVLIGSTLATLSTVTLDQSFDSLLSNLCLISNFPCTHQLIVPIHHWSILNQPHLLLSKVFLWFRFLFLLPIDNSHPPLTRSLVFYFRPLSSSVKYFSGFEFSLHFPIDCPIHPWSILNHPGLLLSIDSHHYPWLLAPTHVTSDILLSSLVFCCQIFLWFPEWTLVHTISGTSADLVFRRKSEQPIWGTTTSCSWRK